MARVGFIHDKLDIKFLILYIMSRVAAPIDMPTLADLTMCDEGVDYFDFAEAAAELVSTEHLLLEDERYSITEKGRKNGAICESSLPILSGSNAIKMSPSSTAASAVTPRCALSASHAMTAPSPSVWRWMMSTGICSPWICWPRPSSSVTVSPSSSKLIPEQIYNGILDVLLTDYEEKE